MPKNNDLFELLTYLCTENYVLSIFFQIIIFKDQESILNNYGEIVRAIFLYQYYVNVGCYVLLYTFRGNLGEKIIHFLGPQNCLLREVFSKLPRLFTFSWYFPTIFSKITGTYIIHMFI